MFKVPIIPPDLRHEETITQAAYALDCLQNTIATIFGRIDCRIEKNNLKIKELQERIKKSQTKISSLHGTRKAIHIYAPARFPAASVFKDLPITFEQDMVESKNCLKYKVESKLNVNLPSPNDKLIFFHVRDQSSSEKLTTENSLTRERCNIKQNQGLGIMPSDLRSIPSVLLFNTDYSVYEMNQSDNESSRKSDACRRAKLFKNKRQHANNMPNSAKHIIEPAPHSLGHRKNEKLTPSGSLKYTPKLSEAPELNLPLDLPDLPGIADDLRYESQEAKQKIAPSLALFVENLPELTELIKDNEEKLDIAAEKQKYNSVTPPPPPPPIPSAKTAIPPTPPPPPPPVFKQAIPTKVTTKLNTVVFNSTDTRSELMAAIRNAGGIGKVHLRHNAAAPLASSDNDVVDNLRPSKISNLTASSQGDLMTDLHNKLIMRRKGISGAKDNTSTKPVYNNSNNNTHKPAPSGNPVISRLSALIPPPPLSGTKGKVTNTSEEDEDTNDADWAD